VAALVDSNVLVYCFDERFPDKQQIARRLMRAGLETGDLRLSHQSLLEFVAATTRRWRGGAPLLSDTDAWHEMQNFLTIYPVLYPTEAVLRAAVQAAALHRLAWFDAQVWAYAEVFGLDEILSEDFQHGRRYGRIRATNPFA
jgi:predicted nucleic acid-binding protein